MTDAAIVECLVPHTCCLTTGSSNSSKTAEAGPTALTNREPELKEVRKTSAAMSPN
jgi:hypothetical protein